MQKVIDEMRLEHEDILNKIKEFEIFSENQTLMSEKFKFPFGFKKEDLGDIFIKLSSSSSSW